MTVDESISVLDTQIRDLTEKLAPSLVAITGCGTLIAAKILSKAAGIRRFKSRQAYARQNGIAPLPVWSGNRDRHRLSRIGNRRLNTALHHIAIAEPTTTNRPATTFDADEPAGTTTKESHAPSHCASPT